MLYSSVFYKIRGFKVKIFLSISFRNFLCYNFGKIIAFIKHTIQERINGC
jgi:hypothetical protein